MRISDLPFAPIAASLLLCLSRGSGMSAGNCTGYAVDSGAVTVRAGGTSVRFSFPACDILRVEYFPEPGVRMDSSFAVIRKPDRSLRLVVRDGDSVLTIASPAITIRCRKYPLRFSFAATGGRELMEEPASGGMETEGAERIARFVLRPGVHFYGTGERGDGLDRRGRAFDCWNTQTGGYSAPPPVMNVCVPYVCSTGRFALFFDDTWRGRFDIGASDSSVMSYTAAGGELTWYLISAPSLATQLARYTWLTGRQPLPPRWAFGYIQSKNRYRDRAEAAAVVDEMRAGRFPCDAIVLDLKWFKAMGDLRWDTTAWPDPDGMMRGFLAKGIRTILISEPYIVRNSVNFTEAVTRGYVGRTESGAPYLLGGWWSCGGCDAVLLDITNPAAREWWWSKYPAFMGRYVAGLWTDLGEPERHPWDMWHEAGPAGKIHNIYDLLWARTIFEGMSRFRPGERVFNLTRAGYAGMQRYGVIPWSGDVSRTFTGLADQPPIILNMGMSGLPYANSDIGGYARNPTTSELYVRWMEFGVFSPVTRAHGAGEMVNGSPTEPWRFGPEAEEICRSMLNLRYALLPYNYTMAHRAYEDGLPLARPLIVGYPHDDRFVNESTEFLWGDDFLVAPVLEAGATSRRVVFPAGDWVNFWTDSVVHGGSTRDVSAPLDRIPLFVRAGSIIPMAPAMDYTDERPLDTLRLSVYPAAGTNSSALLYEDDGHTTAYRSGDFALTRFTQSVTGTGSRRRIVITIGRSKGEYTGKILKRTYIIDVHGIVAAPVVATCRSDSSVAISFPAPSK